jgi:hypothetical protein
MKLLGATVSTIVLLANVPAQPRVVASASLDDTILKHRREAEKREVLACSLV